jgi:hypothetical protein
MLNNLHLKVGGSSEESQTVVVSFSPQKTKDCDTIGLQGGFIPSR